MEKISGWKQMRRKKLRLENPQAEENLHSLFTFTRGCPKLPLPSGCPTIRPTKPSPFKNRPPWAPGAVNDVNARGATRFTSIGLGKCKYSDHDDSSDDEPPSPPKIFGARQSTVTGLTGDSSDEVSNPLAGSVPWLILTHLGLQAPPPPHLSRRSAATYRSGQLTGPPDYKRN